MKNPLLQELDLIIKDISRNYVKFNQNKLIEVVAKFQKDFLSLRKEDREIKLQLESLTSRQILDLGNKMSLNLLSPPKPKNKLITLTNIMILQKGKKEEFLRIIKSIKVSKKVKSSKSPKKKIDSSITDQKSLRKLWLTSKNLKLLEKELEDINMNTIRAVIKPWGVKPSGRTKNALIIATIDYIKRMKRLSKLGT